MPYHLKDVGSLLVQSGTDFFSHQLSKCLHLRLYLEALELLKY